MLDPLAWALTGLGLLLLALSDQPRRRALDRLVRLLQPVDSASGLQKTQLAQRLAAFEHSRPSDRPPDPSEWLGRRWQVERGKVAQLLGAIRLILGAVMTLAIAGLLLFFSRGEMRLGPAMLVGAICGVPAAWFAIRSFVQSQIQLRTQQVAHEMPNAMDLMLISLASGSGLETSLERVALEMANASPEVATELVMLKADLVVLGDYDKAFANLAARVPAAAVTDMASLIRDSLKNGAPIREALSTAIAMQRKQSIIRIDQLGNEVPAKITTVTMVLCFPPLLLIIGAPPVLGLVDALAN